MRTSIAVLVALLHASSANALPRMELRAALEAKVVVVKARGSGISSVQLTLTAKSAVKLSIPAGTFFDTPKDAGYQRMVVTEGTEVTLEAGATREVTVKTACANYFRRVPSPDDAFMVAEAPEGLADLVRCLEKKEVGDHERQAAIWRHTDNVGKREMEERPDMLFSLLSKKCDSTSRKRCEELIKKGLAHARDKLQEKVPALIDECKGIKREERKRDKLKRLLKH